MKLVAITVWLALLALAITAGSCSINHRSGDFTQCEQPSDCPTGQVCRDNLCAEMIDAGANKDGPRPDALACPAQCTSCVLEKMECKVDCAVSPATCNGAITCPPGWNCDIICSVQGSCRAGVNCLAAESCNIECKGRDSCRAVDCGEGPCDLLCTGLQSCRDIDCGDSCRCDVECANGALCTGVICTDVTCKSGLGCSSVFPGCNTCP